MYSLEQGEKLVKLARKAIKSRISKKELTISPAIKSEFSKNSGAFVTLNKNGMLRGCIGITEPVYPLYQAVTDSAVNAASTDPRFPPVDKEELKQVKITVSVLTRPTAINVRNPEEYVNHINVGKDGLMVRGVYNSGLLLPEVAVEQKWDALTFLQQTCIKAGMKPDSYTDFEACRVYKFQSQVFSEEDIETAKGKKA